MRSGVKCLKGPYRRLHVFLISLSNIGVEIWVLKWQFVLENIYSLSSSRDRSSQFAMFQLMNYDRKARHVTTPLTFKQESKKGSNGSASRKEKGKRRGRPPFSCWTTLRMKENECSAQSALPIIPLPFAGPATREVWKIGVLCHERLTTVSGR